MTHLSFDFEWEDPGEIRGPELRATWSRLEISVGGNCVTQLVDRNNIAVRSAVYLPLYPLAEWIAENWRPLFNEIESPTSRNRPTFSRRHNLRYAGDGYILPNLEFLSGGETVDLVWWANRRPDANIEFIASGRDVVATDELQETLAGFVSRVRERLNEQNITDTFLDEEWEAVSNLDPEQAMFANVATALGLDPFGVTEEQEHLVLSLADRLPKEILSEFCTVTDIEQLDQETETMARSIARLDDTPEGFRKLVNLRGEHENSLRPRADLRPWARGYHVARQLRRALNLDGEAVEGLDGLFELFGDSLQSADEAVVVEPTSARYINAIVSEPVNRGPRFLISRNREESKRFAFCRGVHDVLTGAFSEYEIVSESHANKQKQNRAFAAEFLAPAEGLRRDISSTSIDDEEIEDLAERYGVSSLVIENQISNHGLAQILR